MKPQEAIDRLEDMQKQIIHGSKIFQEIADLIKEAQFLIGTFGWTSAERTDVIKRAEKWLGEK